MTQGPAISRRVILDIFILSGAAGLIYEVVWARQLVLVFGNTTQAVSAILTGFFGGMAIGSAVGGRIADRVRRPVRVYGILELVLVVVVILTPVTFRLLHEVYRGAFTSLEANPGGLALVRFVLALLALGPATVLMGATLPTLTRYLSSNAANMSEAFGRLYAANTTGAASDVPPSAAAPHRLVGAAALPLVLLFWAVSLLWGIGLFHQCRTALLALLLQRFAIRRVRHFVRCTCRKHRDFFQQICGFGR